MSNKLNRALLSAILAASVAVLVAQPAEARRGTPPTSQPDYVPPYGGDPEIEPEPDPYAGGPNTPDVTPTVIPVDLGGTETQPQDSPDPGLDPAGSGQTLNPAPADAPSDSQVLAGTKARPGIEPAKAGIAKTGAETLPLARAGVAVLAFGAGLLLLGRRRRQADASA